MCEESRGDWGTMETYSPHTRVSPSSSIPLISTPTAQPHGTGPAETSIPRQVSDCVIFGPAWLPRTLPLPSLPLSGNSSLTQMSASMSDVPHRHNIDTP